MRFVPVLAPLALAMSAFACRAQGPEVGAARLSSAEAPIASAAAMPAPQKKSDAKVDEPPKVHVEPGVVRVLVTGDVAPERGLAAAGRIGDALAPLRPLFQSAQAVVVQEVGVVGVGGESGPRALFASPAWLGELASAHVAAVAVANAHACDGGRPGVARTLDRLSDLGLLALGLDAQEPLRARVLAVNDDHRVCGLAWTTRVRGTECADGRLAVAHGDPARVVSAVAEARERCDAIVAVADGDLSASSRALRAVVDAGVDAVVIRRGVPGASGTPLGVEVVTSGSGRRVPIFESLGSLVSARSRSSRDAPFGLVADLTFKWEGSSRAPSLAWGYDLVATERDGAGRDELVLARPLDASDAKRFTTAPLRRLFASPCWLATGPGCR